MFMTFEQKLKDEAYLARKKGLEEGRRTGLEEGRLEGRLEGRKEGRREERKVVLRMLVEQGLISEEQAAKVLEEAAAKDAKT